MLAGGPAERKAAAGLSTDAGRFKWTPFTHGFVFWESPPPEHLPPRPDDLENLREWLSEFQQAHADYPDALRSRIGPSLGESVPDAIDRRLTGHSALITLKTI